MKKGWADKWAAGNEKEGRRASKKSQTATSAAGSTATGTPQITLSLKDAMMDAENPRSQQLKGDKILIIKSMPDAQMHF